MSNPQQQQQQPGGAITPVSQEQAKKFNRYNGFNITGKLIEIGPVENPTPTYSKRTFILEHLELFNGEPKSNYFKFELGGKGLDKVNPFQVGDYVNVKFTVRGNRYESKKPEDMGRMMTINSLSAYNIQLVNRNPQGIPDATANLDGSAGVMGANSSNYSTDLNAGGAPPASENPDDLPF